MKKLLFIIASVAALTALIFFMPHSVHALPHVTIAGLGLGLAVKRPTGSRSTALDLTTRHSIASSANNQAETPVVPVYNSSGSGAVPAVFIDTDDDEQPCFSITYTLGGSYVANTDIPFVPYTTADALPTGCTATFPNGNWATFAAFSSWFAGGLKFGLFGTIDFNTTASGMLTGAFIRTRGFTDVNKTYKDVSLPMSIAAPNWQNNYQLLEQFKPSTRYATGNLNKQITLQAPAITGSWNLTYFLTDATHGQPFSPARG